MVQGVQHGGEHAETAEAEADRDDAHVLDAVVGEQPLHVVLDRDEDRREDQRHEPEEQKDRMGLAVLPRAPPAIGRYRMMQKRAQLSMTPEKTADTGVGAWLWASGSQVCMGESPAFVP